MRAANRNISVRRTDHFTRVTGRSVTAAPDVMPDTDAAGCTRECVRHGADYVLIVKEKVYTLKPDNSEAQANLNTLAGKTVTISGEPESDFVWVLAVTPAK